MLIAVCCFGQEKIKQQLIVVILVLLLQLGEKVNMKTEKSVFVRTILKLLLVVVCATLYSMGGMGGMGGKWLRRFLAPAICGIGMFCFTKDKRVFIQIPILMASMCLGYGGVHIWTKVVRRAIFGACSGISTSIYNYIKEKYLLVITQIVLLVGMYIIIGVNNPFMHARTEELFLGVCVYLIPILSGEKP